MLTFRLKKELATNTQVTDSTIRHDVTNAHTAVSGAQNDATNTHTAVSDAHRNTLKNPEDTHGKNRMVGGARTLLVIKQQLSTA